MSIEEALRRLHAGMGKITFSETAVRVELQPYGYAWAKTIPEAVAKVIAEHEARHAQRQRLQADPEWPEFQRLLEKFRSIA